MSNDNNTQETTDPFIEEMTTRTGKCGHQDMFAYFANTVCKKCADEGHRRATGKRAKR